MQQFMIATVTVLASALAFASGTQSDVRAARSMATSAPGCADVTPADSALVRQLFRYIVSSSDKLRAEADLPPLPVDSVVFAGTSAQCDSIAARYQAFHAGTADSIPLLPVILLRVGPTRWVADPRVSRDAAGKSNEWITLDSSLTIIKTWISVSP